ncbi:hypothetical protein B7P43_G13184 [Cryptotermes secundus]|uniref:Endonuclease/exonuclease/phosphatase domain-containing protein n=1 Tax=Cryptotermes secundus TaxID=105785 RepID=A0A2J7Q477_9NEOP|nr:hypothetical protein B7P43_G13184 [Cryptotermes secundus]
MHTKTRAWTDPLDKGPKLKKMDMRFDTWNVRNMAGSLRAVAEEMLKCKLDLAGVQKVRWDGGGTAPAGEYTFFYGKGNENYKLGIGFFVHWRIVLAVKRVEFISDRISYNTKRSQVGPKGHEVTRRWRKLHNEELHNLYSFMGIIRMIKSRRMRWAGSVARIGEKRNAYRILVGKPDRKMLLGRPRRRWVDNIKLDLR